MENDKQTADPSTEERLKRLEDFIDQHQPGPEEDLDFPWGLLILGLGWVIFLVFILTQVV